MIFIQKHMVQWINAPYAAYLISNSHVCQFKPLVHKNIALISTRFTVAPFTNMV